jgi:hypothetical protein
MILLKAYGRYQSWSLHLLKVGLQTAVDSARNHWYDSVIRGQSNDDWCKPGVLELDIRGGLQGGQCVGSPRGISS